MITKSEKNEEKNKDVERAVFRVQGLYLSIETANKTAGIYCCYNVGGASSTTVCTISNFFFSFSGYILVDFYIGKCILDPGHYLYIAKKLIFLSFWQCLGNFGSVP
jgi:hypothetical protein